MVNYTNGKIYMICPIADHEEGEVYIGSTTKQYLCDRMYNHRDMYEKYKVGYSNRYSVFDLFDKYGVSGCSIYFIEECPVDTKDEQHAREGFHIRNTKCVNKIVPDRTREEVLERKRQYRIDNKDKLKEYIKSRKEKINCACGGCYTLNHKYKHVKTKKHLGYMAAEKEKISEVEE